MAQGILPYKYEEDKKAAGMTSLAGLPLYLDLSFALGLPDSIGRHLTLRPSRGWTDSRMVLSLMLLALAGGDCVDDLKVLEADEGFCRILKRMEPEVSPAHWRTEKARTVPSPSPSSVFLIPHCLPRRWRVGSGECVNSSIHGPYRFYPHQP
jgi:hypothetical protein